MDTHIDYATAQYRVTKHRVTKHRITKYNIIEQKMIKQIQSAQLFACDAKVHPQPWWRFTPILQILLFAATLAIAGSWGLQFAAAQPLATTAVQPTMASFNGSVLGTETTAFDCEQRLAVSADECRALVSLYEATSGPKWRQQDRWLMAGPAAPCDWHGVRCTDGHVTQLLLAANQLSGTLPITIGYLSELTTLRLENNALSGNVLPKVCNIIDGLKDFSIAYNLMSSRFKVATECLNQLEPNWLATQTLAPRNLTITEFFTAALRLTWSPIPYTDHGGYYEISYATSMAGPYTVHGKTADKRADTYLLDGLQPGQRYFIRVRTYTPPHGAQENALTSPAIHVIGMTKATAGHVLVAAYFPADNDLSNQIRYVTRRMQRGTAHNPNVTVLLLVDGLGTDNTELLYIRDGEVKPTDVVETVWRTKELDTADPEVLSWFLRYARSTVPASKVVVSLMGHGLALAPELDFGDTSALAGAQVSLNQAPTNDKFPALPRDWDDTPNDVTSNSYMSTTDMGRALLAATDDGANPFDVVFFDQCFQGNLDALYEVHKTAKLFIASPNYAWLVAAYDKYIVGFSPAASAEELGFVILNQYEATLNNRHPNAILGIRGVDIPPVATAMSALGDVLTAVVNDGQNERIARSVMEANYVDTTQCGRRTLQLGPPDELIGIEGLAKALQEEFQQNDPHGVVAATEQIRTVMQQVVKRSRSGNPHIAPDQYWDYQDSLTVLAPLPRNSPSGVAWRASIYSAKAPFAATWMLDPTQPLMVTESLAYTKDGRWDDFLAVWFQNLRPTVGQWCNYIPPEQVVLDDAEALTLTLTLQESHDLMLEWNATGDNSAIEYLVYLDGPYDVSWEVADSLSITETTTNLAALDSGEYQVRVLARNEEEIFVAQSNIATVEIPDILSPEAQLIYLPIVVRE